MGPHRVNVNQADDNTRLTDLYNALGYSDVPDLPSSVEGIYKVYPAQTAEPYPRPLDFEILTHSSFSLGKIRSLLLEFFIN
jgi:hypothetical protein